VTSTEALRASLVALTPAYLPRQRWYSGPEQLDPARVRVRVLRELCRTGPGDRHLHQAIVEVADAEYQLLVGERPAGEPAEFLHGHDAVLLGVAEGSVLYDATVDPELARELLPIVTAGVESATRVRPVSAEQSNTSLVFDDRIILKVFRRLHHGRNPDVEVTTTLARAGFAHVAAPVASWRLDDVDLGFAQQFLAGGVEGWALALTSLRDFYDASVDDPAAAGGDFSMEARRLGRVTAALHCALAEAYGTAPLPPTAWSTLLDDIDARLAEGGPAGSSTTAALRELGGSGRLGLAGRVHGDYHLGQVMRADRGWYVLDFEGEPARPLEARAQAASPLKDVAGMLRSLDYAARVAAAERGGADATLAAHADAWVAHNRRAFLSGYLDSQAVARLLPDPEARDALLVAYELDKALYERDYEAAYRPGWLAIPEAAIARIVAALRG
jgi:maltokinase